MHKYPMGSLPRREDYLRGLAEDTGLPFKFVLDYANLLGPSEDYDALVMLLDEESMDEDNAARIWREYDPANSPF